MTRAPIRVTSALTLRIQPGRSRSTLRPDSDSVLSMMYRATAGPPQQRALTQRSEVYHALSASDAPGREMTRMATHALRSRNWFGPRTLDGLMHRAYLLDAVVLLSGCDKTTPAMLMGAASADVPAIMVTGGPMLRGAWRTEELGSGTDARRLWAERRAGRLTDEELCEVEACLSRSS